MPNDGRTCWESVLAKDATMAGQFVYAVRTTGVYCRPGCPSRRPQRENVEFFRTTEEARRAGFRACLRCQPDQAAGEQAASRVVKQLCRYIEDHLDEPLTLRKLGDVAGLSPFHLQRTFKAALGISPREYADACRLRAFKARLREGDSVTGAIYEAGYGSSSRLYHRAASQLGMTPVTYRRGAAGARIRYTVASSPLGSLLIAATNKGICAIRFGDKPGELARQLREEYGAAEIERDDAGFELWIKALGMRLNGAQEALDLPLDIRATAFQRRVWEHLRGIPFGATESYGAVAKAIGEPGAARAVARACASNPVAVVIPCHRVVRGDGELGGYRWGTERKKQLLALERRTGPMRS